MLVNGLLSLAIEGDPSATVQGSRDPAEKLPFTRFWMACWFAGTICGAAVGANETKSSSTGSPVPVENDTPRVFPAQEGLPEVIIAGRVRL